MLVLGLVSGLVGGVLVVIGWELFRGDDSSSPRSAASPSACDIAGVAAQVLPSVVTLSVSEGQDQGTGSGVIVRSPIREGGAEEPSPAQDGTFIVTNHHVVAPGGTPGQVEVTYADGETAPATVVGTDDVTDLAVVDREPSRQGAPGDHRIFGRPPGRPAGGGARRTARAQLHGDHRDHQRDRPVRAGADELGHHPPPRGRHPDRRLDQPRQQRRCPRDCDGALVGINSAGASPPGDSGSVGLNFAIPSTLFAPLGNELISSGKVRHPTLGMQVAAVSPQLAAANGVSAGLFVQAVVDGGPAQKAGIRPRDVLVEIDGKPVRSPEDLTQLELETDVGDSVKMTVERGSQRAKVPVTVVAAQ